ncbi:hypothetical protein [Fluviicola sp.]|uniref:hypothetical protein n=1 Tax=Fluviicola sp. TaxID=1917219 RepID=UPI003D2D7909
MFSRYLQIRVPKIPLEPDYQEIVKYLQEHQRRSINYYRIVFLIGLLGLFLSIILYICLIVNNPSAVKDLKSYPSVIPSLVTMSFGHLEMEMKKKELYKQLQKITIQFKDWNDANTIADDYKKWAWSEFQDKFKPEKP